MKNIIIAIDGPAGSGKSTVSKIMAEKLKIEYIDTGAMYRAVTYKLLNLKCDLNDEDSIIKVLDNSSIDFIDNSVILDDQPLTDQLRTPIVNRQVSHVASIAEVRNKLVDIQRKIGNKKSVVMDGRDIGTNVFPNADYKFYLSASADERAMRRCKEMKEKRHDVSLEEIRDELINRDKMDMSRKNNPLKKATDSIEISTTNKSIEEVVKEILSYVKY